MTHFDLRIHFRSFLRWVAQYGPITLYDLESRWCKSHWLIIGPLLKHQVSCVRSMSCHQLWGPTARSQDSRAPPFTYVRTDAFHLQVGVPSEGERSCVRGVQAVENGGAEVGGLYQGSLGWSFQFLKEKMVHLLWFHNFRNGELAKMGDGFGWPEQGTLLWKLKLGMALMALDNLKSLQVSRRGLLMSTSFSDWYVF